MTRGNIVSSVFKLNHNEENLIVLNLAGDSSDWIYATSALVIANNDVSYYLPADI